MNNNIFQGQQIEVIQFNLCVEGYQANLSMEFLLNKESFRLLFYNVSSLKIREFSMPFQICGFEIIDNKDRGWDNSLRYTIHDFEEGMIEFFCEDFALRQN